MLGGCYPQGTSLSYEGPTSGEGHFFFLFIERLPSCLQAPVLFLWV